MNRKLLQQLKPEQIEVDVVRVEEPEERGVEEAELDAPVERESAIRRTRVGFGTQLIAELVKF
ncbi:MAG: hypothetical protein JO235_26980 [Chroococcidiopsidaceae cyanobacterium CP_BM_RX_35]|nr:hypothetical protein [Chroococcidiopsidaceae cyanobacterium CP_BM_RX_35]